MDRSISMDGSQWIDYVSDKKVKTYVLKHKDDLAGFFELIFHSKKRSRNSLFWNFRRISK